MTIYTKKGDRGQTGLPGGRRLSKGDPIFDVLGNLDLTNSCIGLAISLVPKKERQLIAALKRTQQILLSIGATLAAESEHGLSLTANLNDETKFLEDTIDEWDRLLPELKNFILPGGGKAGAALHLSRSITRQTEREYQKTAPTKSFPEIDAYLNRLSDFFFQAARYINFRENSSENVWKS